GGSLGPAGTRTKYGPVTHLAQTYSCTARTDPPASAHAWTGLDEARGCAYTDSESIAWIAVLWLNAVGILRSPSCDHHTPALTPATGGTRTSVRHAARGELDFPIPRGCLSTGSGCLHPFFQRFGSFQVRSSGRMPPPNGVNCVMPSSSMV